MKGTTGRTSGRTSLDRDQARWFVERLCAWYSRAARDLPWRRTRDPYAIWISEAMLQQTRAATVVPYWERFLARFPDVLSLADAEEGELLAHWSGLGYYARARRLRDAARAMVAEHGGRLPETRDALLALPGIGPYTAGAVASIAFGERAPLVDGNVARVFARLFELDELSSSSAGRKLYWELAERLVAVTSRGARAPGAWNQALMELGATLCSPREPSCLVCPLAQRCRARASGRQHELPRRPERAAPHQVALLVLVVRRGQRVLLERRPSEGRMAGLLELPTRELPEAGGATRLWPAAFGHPKLTVGAELARVRHAITTHRIAARVCAGELPRGARLVPASRWAWSDAEQLADAALTGMARKVLARLE